MLRFTWAPTYPICFPGLCKSVLKRAGSEACGCYSYPQTPPVSMATVSETVPTVFRRALGASQRKSISCSPVPQHPPRCPSVWVGQEGDIPSARWPAGAISLARVGIHRRFFSPGCNAASLPRRDQTPPRRRPAGACLPQPYTTRSMIGQHFLAESFHHFYGI